MSSYVSSAANALASEEELKRKASPSDAIALMLIPRNLTAVLPPPILKALVDYEVEALRAALYTYYQIS